MAAEKPLMRDPDVSITDDPSVAVGDPRLVRLYEHLEKKRAGRAFAARRDVDPVDFPYILGNVLLIDVLYEPLRFRYRLVGSNLVFWRGLDLTGTFLDEHPDREYAAAIVASCRKVVEGRQKTGGIRNTFLDGKPRYYEALRVPLSDDGTSINMILMAVIAS